jgi:hypothetical protein
MRRTPELPFVEAIALKDLCKALIDGLITVFFKGLEMVYILFP